MIILALDFSGLLNSFTNQIQQAFALMLMTMAVVLIFKTSFTTNFAMGAISTVAALISSVIYYKLGVPNPWIWLSLSMVTGILVAGFFNFALDRWILKINKHMTPVGVQMVTMGFVLMIGYFFAPLFQDKESGEKWFIPRIGGIGNESFGSGSVSIYKDAILTMGIAIAILLVIFVLLKYTKWGLAVRATASNKQVAELMGINTANITAISWALAGGLAAIAGITYSLNGNEIYVHSQMLNTMIYAFIALVVGGTDTFFGPVIVSFFIPVLNGILAYLLSALNITPGNGAIYAPVIVYIIIIVIMSALPRGIFSKKVQVKV